MRAYLHGTSWLGMVFAGLSGPVPTLPAQTVPVDTAAVIWGVAEDLRQEGRIEWATQLMRILLEKYPSSAWSQLARRELDGIRQARWAESGRSELTYWATGFGAWLGVVIPAALGADEPEPFGAGLLIGGPVGFASARAYGRSRSMSRAQARAMSFGSIWTTYQAMGWQQVSSDGSDRGPWVAALVGGVVGTGAGAFLGQRLDPSSGQMTMVVHGSGWGSWFGLALSQIAEFEDEDANLAATLIGSELGVLLGALGGSVWDPSSGQVWLTSAAGLVGLTAGFGLDLLAGVDDVQTGFLIPTVGSAVGLVLGASMSRNGEDDDDGLSSVGNTLIEHTRQGTKVRLPLPNLVPDYRSGKSGWALRVGLLQAEF